MRVTLYREIDALGGTATTEWGGGYGEALDDVLTILSSRGFNEEADATPALDRMRDQLRHYIGSEMLPQSPKSGYGSTKTSGWNAALVPEWQLRQWEAVTRQPVHSAPFSSYPEDREKLLQLARECEQSADAKAVELGDLVRAILEDEAVSA